MSCEHGNWAPCELCEALEAVRLSGRALAGKLALLLRECDAALAMLSGNPAAKTRAKIAELLAEEEL